MDRHHRGFSLIELLIILAIIGILSGLAFLAYQMYIAKTQVTEAIIQAGGLKPNVVTNIASGSCGDESSTGTYGVAVVAGTAPDCTITYTFNTTKATAILKSKVIGFNVGLNGSLTINTDTTVDNLYLPSSFQ